MSHAPWSRKVIKDKDISSSGASNLAERLRTGLALHQFHWWPARGEEPPWCGTWLWVWDKGFADRWKPLEVATERVMKFTQLQILCTPGTRASSPRSSCAVPCWCSRGWADCMRITGSDGTLGALEKQCIWKIISLKKLPTLLFKI